MSQTLQCLINLLMLMYVTIYFLDGALYYLKGPGKVIKAKVVRGTEEAAIFRDFHDSSTGAHTGQKKTQDAISKRFFWPGMTADIDKWVSKHCN